jgi:hypothetical protein
LDLLAPGAPFLEVLARCPRSPEVHYHAIVGVAPPTPAVIAERLLAGDGVREPGDGIVRCGSARLSGVDSEYAVAADHSEVLRTPATFVEVLRILREHEREVARWRESEQAQGLQPIGLGR